MILRVLGDTGCFSNTPISVRASSSALYWLLKALRISLLWWASAATTMHERQAGGTFGGNRNNIAVFGKDALLVYAEGTTQLDNSVKDLCGSGVLTGQAGYGINSPQEALERSLG